MSSLFHLCKKLQDADATLLYEVVEHDQTLSRSREENAEGVPIKALRRQTKRMDAFDYLTGGVAHDLNKLLVIATLRVHCGLAIACASTSAWVRSRKLGHMLSASKWSMSLSAWIAAFLGGWARNPTMLEHERCDMLPMNPLSFHYSPRA